MDNNDFLRRFRYALDVRDAVMLNIFALGGCRVDGDRLRQMLKKETEPDFLVCGDSALAGFLDGLITLNRGASDQAPPAGSRPPALTNNDILKKIKIALALRQEDLMDIFSLAGVRMSKGELSALFRKKGHKNYRPCQDQFLRLFLKGLGIRHRR